MTALEDPVVFDAEPLLAYALDEPGSDRVESYLDSVYSGSVTGYVSVVQLAEVQYILSRIVDRDRVDAYLEYLERIGVVPHDATSVWRRAGEHKQTINPALGDAFALATADHVDGTLLVGADSDFDDVTAVSIERFRDEPA